MTNKVFEILFEEFDDGELNAALSTWCSAPYAQENDGVLMRVMLEAKARALEIAEDRKKRGL